MACAMPSIRAVTVICKLLAFLLVPPWDWFSRRFFIPLPLQFQAGRQILSKWSGIHLSYIPPFQDEIPGMTDSTGILHSLMGMMKLEKYSLHPDAQNSVKEESMSVSLFVGLVGGAVLGFATQNGRSQLCEFVRVRHPVLFKSIGVSLLVFAILVPTLELNGAFNIAQTPFFWGGCMALSFIYSFFTVHCQILQPDQKY